MTKFFQKNECKFSILEESFRTDEFELKRLLDLYKNDISADWSIDRTNIETLCNGTQFFKTVGIDPKIAKELALWKEFKITIEISKLTDGEFKNSTLEHLEQKINENGREINSFSQDITEIIDSAFQKYLEKNKLTFDFKSPEPNINYSDAEKSQEARSA